MERSKRQYGTKRTLVTGGAGFLGSHLCDALLARGHEVLCVDNYFTGARGNIAHLLDNPRFELMRHDVTFPLYVEVDEIYNLACPASPVHIAVQDESYWGNVNPIGIRSCYDEGKRAAETLFMDYHRQHGLDIKIVRIFNTYGPRMNPSDGRVVSNFIVQALKGEPITIYGDGQQTRSFCYYADLIRGFLSLMDSEASFTGPCNIGNPNEFSMIELAEMVIELIGSSSKLINQPLPQDDPKQRCPDITLARTKLDWEPKVQLREGLTSTIAYFDKLLSADALVV